jgi:hypothetical protein
VRASFNRLAEQELIAAARYLQAEAGLGRQFLLEFEAWQKQVLRFPESCPEIAPGIRCGYLRRFKYHVTYTVRGDGLRILYIRSARRMPLRDWPRS